MIVYIRIICAEANGRRVGRFEVQFGSDTARLFVIHVTPVFDHLPISITIDRAERDTARNALRKGT